MHNQKIAIIMPESLLHGFDTLSKKRGISLNRYITEAVSRSIKDEKKRYITECCNRLFSKTAIQKEQLETARNFENAGNESGQE